MLTPGTIAALAIRTATIMSGRINPGVMSRVKKDSLRVYPVSAVERGLVVLVNCVAII
jgi:hypothetical protein